MFDLSQPFIPSCYVPLLETKWYGLSLGMKAFLDFVKSVCIEHSTCNCMCSNQGAARWIRST